MIPLLILTLSLDTSSLMPPAIPKEQTLAMEKRREQAAFITKIKQVAGTIVPHTNFVVWQHSMSNVASFHVWSTTNVTAPFAFDFVTTNRSFVMTNDRPRKFFRLRAVAPSGAVSEWATH